MAAFLCASMLAPGVAKGDQDAAAIYATHQEKPGPRFANWFGVDVLARSQSAYAGMTVALQGTLEEAGWRLRASGGMGRYTYVRGVIGANGPERRKFKGDNVFADLLVGYQFHLDRTTLKLFAGADSEQHFVNPYDPLARATDTAFGAKVAAEVWHWFSNQHWGALNASYATTFETYKVEGRTGFRVSPMIDIGVEARVEGNTDYDAGRIGGFAMLRIGETHIMAASGISGDRSMKSSPYGTLSVFLRY